MGMIINDKFNKIILDKEKNTHYHITKVTTAFMREIEFKYMLLEWKKTVFESLPRLILVDNRDFRFSISPEMQLWTAKNISVPVLALDAVAKFCFVMPEELITKLSVAQLTTESNSLSVGTQMIYFTSKEEAEQWLAGTT